MSYDISLVNKKSEFVFDANYTSNVSEMWYEHFDTDNGLHSLQDMTWKQAKHHFAAFWESINQDRDDLYVDGAVGEPKFCSKYDDENGWGSAIGAMIFIARLQSAWAMNPKATLSVWA